MKKKRQIAERTTYCKFLSFLLSVMLTISVTFCAGAPVDAISTKYPFTNGQRIFLDATAFSSWWIQESGRPYYPYMYLFNDNVSPSIKCWVPMTKAENTDGLILTGNVPEDGNTYYGLIFTRNSSNTGNWDYRTHQTIDIEWDGQSNCYILSPSSYASSKLYGIWGDFHENFPETEGAYTVITESSGSTVTAVADGKKTGTADARDIVTVTIALKDGYSLSAVTVTGKSKTQYEITQTDNYTYTFTMPEEKVTVKAECTFDKASAFTGNVFWVDTQPSVTDSPIGLIHWTNRTGSSDYTNIYTLYLPGGVGTDLPVYFGTGSLTIDGQTIEQGQSYHFDENTTYYINGVQMKVIQSDSASVYLQTQQDLVCQTVSSNIVSNEDNAQLYKETTRQTDGRFMSVDKNGTIIDAPQTLSQIKGRGNSSWEASCRYFGKYAYNIKLDKKADILNMGAVKAKSFCLLANNMDESLLRNAETYQAAAMAGLGYVPHYEVADVYNNGEYLGSYLITEKVDVGKSKLVQGETVEDYHNDQNATGNLRTGNYYFNERAFTFEYVDTGMIDEGVDFTKKSYLLEFDLKKRATKEHCWFQTPQGQYISIKSPEDLNEEEMLFIIGKWINAENAVYNGNFTDMDELMDLSSFADVYLIQEFTKNLDSGATSYYVYYDGTQDYPKWQAMPIWDYDWALGGWGGVKPISSSDAEASNRPSDTTGWFARYKCLTISDNEYFGKNLQAKLCENTTFWDNYVLKAWNSHIYSALSEVFTQKIYDDYNSHSKSFAMNETRYGFISRHLIESWGSVVTGSTPEQAYNYLRHWGNERLSWMHQRLQVPFSNVSLSADKTLAACGDVITLTAVPYPSYTQDISYTFIVDGEETNTYDRSFTVTIPQTNYGTFDCKVLAGNYESNVITITVLSKIDATEPNCTTPGNIEYYTDGTNFYKCSKKGNYKAISPEDTVIPATGHSYEEPIWNWSSNYDSATASLICKKCQYLYLSAADVTSTDTGRNIIHNAHITFEQNEYNNSVTTSTVSFNTQGGSTIPPQTVVLGEMAVRPDTPTKEGYNFDGWFLNNAIYNFNTAVVENITLTANWKENITYTPVPAVAATCTNNGNILYYRGSNGKIYKQENGVYIETTEGYVIIPATGHSYSEPSWTWTDENTATAGFVCTKCHDIQIVTAAVTSETTEPTYDTEGSIVYTATVVFNGQTYNNTKTVIVPKKEHTPVIINFVDINGIVTSKTVYAETFNADDLEIPSNPYLDGYTFKHWTVNNTVCTSVSDLKSNITDLVTSKIENIEIKAVYEKTQTTHTVTVPNGSFEDDETVKTFHVSDLVTVTANRQAPEQDFSYWTRDGKIVSYDRTYSFFMPDKDILLSAVYTDSADQKGIAFIEKVEIDPVSQKMIFVSVCNVPENCTMTAAGIIASTDVSKIASYESDNLKRLSGKVTENTKNLKYTWTVGVKNSETILYVRSYVAYTTPDGENHEILGDIIQASLDEWHTFGEVIE